MPQLRVPQALLQLLLARAEVGAANEICEQAIRSELVPNQPLFWAFHNAAVISYGRAFHENKPLGKLDRASWPGFTDAHLRAQHKEVMEQRNEAVAHADMKRRTVILIPRNTELPDYGSLKNEALPEDRIVPKVMFGITREGLTQESYAAIQLLCHDLLPRLTAAINRLYFDMFPEGYDGPEVALVPEPEPAERRRLINVSFRRRSSNAILSYRIELSFRRRTRVRP